MNIMFMFREHLQSFVLTWLFKSKERMCILRYISIRSSFTVQSVADATGVSKGLVSQYLNMFIQEELLSREHRLFSRKETVLWQTIKRLLNLDLLRTIVLLPPWAAGIGIYGSWADGTNTTESDLDLWILVKHYTPELEINAAELEQNLAAEIQCEVNSLLLTGEKLRQLKAEDQPFYLGLMKGNVTIEGKNLEIA